MKKQLEHFCDPGFCDECVALGDGGFLCLITQRLVVDDYTPTENYMGEGCLYHIPNPACSCEYKLGDNGSMMYLQSWNEEALKTPAGVMNAKVTLVAILNPNEDTLHCDYIIEARGKTWTQPYQAPPEEMESLKVLLDEAYRESGAINGAD